MKKHLLIALALLLAAGAATAQTSLTVNANPAMNGTTQGLEVIFDGASTTRAFVQDNTPTAETVYRATFWFDPNDVVLGGTRPGILLGRGSAGAIWLQLREAFGTYYLRFRCFDNGGGWRKAFKPGTTQQNLPIPNGPVEVTIESIMLNGQQGFCQITANGQTYTRDTYQAGNSQIDTLFFGATRDVKTNQVGSYYLDEFSSFRTLAP